ncbi:MAG TPA: hypothetical protein VMU50_22000 [Polyangia bacterium]|nr:hypothetical protein [Polyangia bacterium]
MKRFADRLPTLTMKMPTPTDRPRATARFAGLARVPALAALLGLALLAWTPIGCGSSKPAADGGAPGTGGGSGSGTGGGNASGTGGGSGSGSGGSNGSGGFTFDASAFDLGFNLDGFNLDGFNFSDLRIDGLNIVACPAGVKNGDACTSVGETCVATAKGCECSALNVWLCIGI